MVETSAQRAKIPHLFLIPLPNYLRVGDGANRVYIQCTSYSGSKWEAEGPGFSNFTFDQGFCTRA